MAKKKKHLKTDKRSRTRRAIFEQEKRERRMGEKNDLIANFGTREEATKLWDSQHGGQIFSYSRKKLEKRKKSTLNYKAEQNERAFSELAKKRTQSRMNNSPFATTKTKTADKQAKHEAKLNERAIRAERREREEKRQAHFFHKWKYKHHLKNPHGYEWFSFREEPHFDPKNSKERQRDKRLYRSLQQSLNNPDEEMAREQFENIARQIEENAMKSGAKEFLRKKGRVSAEDLSLRGITSINANQYYLNYNNYLAAAKEQGMDILVNAINKGGEDFTDWLYYGIEFKWVDFYSAGNNASAMAVSDAERHFFENCRQYRYDSKWGHIMMEAYNAYTKKYGWK